MIRGMAGDSSSMCVPVRQLPVWKTGTKQTRMPALPWFRVRAAVLSTVAVWLALSFGSPCMEAGVQQDGTGASARQTGVAPTITPRVAVSAIVESGSPQQPALWQRAAGWLLVVSLIAVLYIAVYFSSKGAVRTKFPAEPTTSPRPLHVARNLVLGVSAFICLDGIIFHSGLYTSILAPESYAGRLELLTRAEKRRTSSGLREVLVLGDSRMAEGFSTATADELASGAGFKFVSLAEPAASVSTWYYMLREVDPTTRRYWAIVVPYGIGYEPSTADPLRISMVAPLLRYGDCFSFASGFERWSGRFRAFTACILRGSAFQSDVTNFLEHPVARIRSIQHHPKTVQSRAVYRGRNYDIVGTSYDPRTGHLTFPSRLNETQRKAIRDSMVRPSQSEAQDFLRMQRDGIQRIVDRYSVSSTAVVLTPVPRGPFGELPGFSMVRGAGFLRTTAKTTAFSIPEQTFEFLEKPEYYFDGYHLNAKGRQKFTETLVTEVVERLSSADSHPPVKSELQPVVRADSVEGSPAEGHEFQ
jgi:hypothetical protein